jgi:citrate lyase subunit beta/citryl-CoA lyase
VTFEVGPALLFCPADRPDRFAKALERADAVILDLEDAVAPHDKAAAREAVIAHQLDPTRTIVRVNPAGTDDHDLDLEALDETNYRFVMLAKASGIADLEGLAGRDVIALCETAAGVLAAPELAAHDDVVALMWGAEDLVVSLGGSSSRFADGRYRDVAAHARSSVLLAAGAHGKSAVDAVFLDIANTAGLDAEARDAAAVGFAATACIHPSQVAVIRTAYAPSADELDYARELLAAAENERGVFVFRGAMVDEPLLALARRTLARA